MLRRIFLSRAVGSLACLGSGSAGKLLEAFSQASASATNPLDGTDSQQTSTPSPRLNELIDRIFRREKEQEEIIASYAPIVETYIQEQKSNALMGTVPKRDYYFLGQADFRGKNMKVHSMVGREHKGSIMWEYEPDGFLQMAFLDWGGFDQDHYRLTTAKKEVQRVFLGQVRCYILDVEPLPKARGPRFVGEIWVEDQDYTIVRMSGIYDPDRHFSLRHFDDEFYVHFDSWRTNVKPGVWLPSDIYAQELGQPVPTGGPRFKARTHFWGFGLSGQTRQEEMGRLVLEAQGNVKDESERPDRTPLEQQRGWRELSERNVMDVLERVGLVAPDGDVDRVLNTIVNNIVVTNSLDPETEIKCRVLLTSDLEMFSMHKTIVISRGLIDVVPNEETLAAMLAFEIADAMMPKPAQDQYAFSDILRLTPTEALKKLSFVDKPEEARKNSERALEWLKKSPYGDKLANVGLFLSQLQSQKAALKQLISARLGNQVYFTSQLLQIAPVLQPANVQQIGALPMGSRIKINPWTDGVSLMKTQQMRPISPREKLPFEVTPINLYLTRYVESSAEVEHSIVPRTEIPVAGAADPD